MLPQIGTFGQNEVKLSNDINRQPSAVNSKLNQVQSMIGTRLGNIGSPGLALQTGMFKAFGNNVLTQGVSQLTGLFSDLLGKINKTDDSNDRSDIPEGEERRQSTRLAEADRSILKEMLKALLRIDRGIENVGTTSSDSPASKKFNPLAKQEQLSERKAKLAAGVDRKSAEDLLSALDNKVPGPARPKKLEHSNLQERMHNISGNIESQAMQGVYSAFGYNTFTQSLTEGAGFVGDSLTDLVSGNKKGKVTKDNPTGDADLERILANPKTENGQLVVEPVVAEIKQSETILEKMLASLNSMNDMFKKFFGATDKISSQEADLEKGVLPKPYKQDGKYIYPPREAAVAAVPAIPEGSSGLLDNLIDPLPGMRGGPKAPAPKGSGIFKNVLKGAKALAIPAVIAGAAGYGLDAAVGAAGVGKDENGKELVLDTKQDDANWEKMSTWEKMQSSAARGIEKAGSFMFLDNMSKEAASKRIASETEYMKKKEFDWKATEKQSRADSLNTGVSELEKTKLASNTPQTNGNNTVNNNTNINNQTILPNRNTVRNIDSTASRYFDRALG